MLLKKIELTNIGPFEGKNIFIFNTKDLKNTILIGGKNGSGKTTFLNSLKLGLYGPLAFGFKTPTNNYLNQIRILLNDKAKANPANNTFSINITFTIIENFERSYIEIYRRWTYSNSSIKEFVEFSKNGELLNDVEKDDFIEKLRTTFPPSLLELCFFDGEDISKLTNDKELTNFLRELSLKLFNLDLFTNLEENLKKYLTQNVQSTKENNLLKEKKLIESKLNEKVSNYKELNNKLEKLSEHLKDTKDHYKLIRKQFSTHGGLLYSERDQLQKKILFIENKRKEVNEQIKEFIARELPFFLSYPLLKKLVNQLHNEEEYHVSNIISTKIKNISLSKLEQTLNISLDNQKKNSLLEFFQNELTDSDDINIIHNASKTETNQIFSLLSSINNERLNQIYKLIESYEKDLIKLSQLNQKLKDNESTPEFHEMIISMENDTKKISQLELEIEQLKEQKELLGEEIDRINSQYEKINRELHNIYKKKSSYDVTQKVITVSKKFRKDQLRRKIKDIEYFSTKMINELLRKKNFINSIQIDHENFQIYLKDDENNFINKETLSAGEKELLILALIWGTIHSSKKELPFVFDTLLGRLDLEHKSSVINKLIPKFGKQIIILSTNSEITEDLYLDLSPYISNEYTLNFDSKEKRTNIESHFFNNSIERAKIL